ncbi:vacuolar morphogenesis protein 7 [[Candida] jaroonii]|uniref:Vacuolar morphogenesis protein 7 n=1 Tax=[Candida] jaroonii TaxID=467808 RepID=A0ACA9Y518_9ASCO|nr:vacuolar morphogenesis protein 7 [[Candida] jaroonii]
MTSIKINDTSTNNKITYYHIDIKLPLRSHTVYKRYNEFVNLIADLTQDLGIDHNDFPYHLPPKTSFFNKNSESIISQRKQGLSKFLNELVNDSELMNNPIFHDFLQLPPNFKFSKSTNNLNDLNITNDLDPNQWLDYIRLFKTKLSSVDKTKLNYKKDLNTYFKPNLHKLIKSLDDLKSQLDDKELDRRKVLVSDLSSQILNLEQDTKMPGSFINTTSKRVIGKIEETKDTLPLSNQELLQYQQQIHKNQDQEIGELRKIIERQKQIGMVINQEVEEQNEMLDELNDQVDITTNKLRGARRKAKKIL